MSKTVELYQYMGARRFCRWHLYWLTSGLLPRHFDMDAETRDASARALMKGLS